MEKPEIIDIIDDRLELRFESYAQSQILLHNEYHEKMRQTVENQIQVTVNGKIDKIQKSIDNLTEQITPVTDTRKWFSDLKSGAGWVAGFLTPLAIIGGMLMYVFKQIKQ